MPLLRSLPLLIGFALALAGCEKKPDPLASAQIFFQQVAAGQALVAYQHAAFGFQVQRSAAAFEAAAKEMGLIDSSAEWGQPDVDGRTAKVPVRIRTRAGQDLPLIVTLLKESGTWRVYSLRSPPSDATGISANHFTLVGKAPAVADAANQPVPPELELRRLVRENLLRFNEAIAAKSFDGFYDTVALKWQEQLTKGQLQRAFQPFIDKQVNIADIQNVEPIWNAPASVGTDGLLMLSGYYPTEPYRVHFALKFIYELPTWKLFGFDMNLRK